MAFPIKNISPATPSNPAENSVAPNLYDAEGGPLTPEGAPVISNAPAASDQSSKASLPVDPNTTVPQPGKIVDKSINHKEHITSLSTPDPLTVKADQEENEFIPKVEEVHDAAYHDKHS